MGNPFATWMPQLLIHLFIIPIGDKGELALSGKQIAKGYFKDGRMTSSRFPSVNGRVWYLTGDLAYQDLDGVFHHLGRTDYQVKILGYRVELEDVEAHLREVCGVDSVAAVAWPIARRLCRRNRSVRSRQRTYSNGNS